MSTVLITAKSLDVLNWPLICPSCGKDMTATRRTDKNAELTKHIPDINSSDLDQVRSHMKSQETEKLLDIYRQHNINEWRPEAFHIIRQILEERGVQIPQQTFINLPEVVETKHKVPVGKAAKVLLAKGTPQAVEVSYCNCCSRRLAIFTWISKFGWAIAGVIFLLAALVHHPRTPEEWTGVGGVFWLGCLLGWLGDSRVKRKRAIRIKRLSKIGWSFSCQNETFDSAFRNINIGNIAEQVAPPDAASPRR